MGSPQQGVFFTRTVRYANTRNRNRDSSTFSGSRYVVHTLAQPCPTPSRSILRVKWTGKECAETLAVNELEESVAVAGSDWQVESYNKIGDYEVKAPEVAVM